MTVVAVLFVLALSASLSHGEDVTLEAHQVLFEKWMKSHEKDYSSSKIREERFAIWRENHDFIEQHNSRDPKPLYLLGHNQFSDLTLDEYRRFNFLGTYNPTPWKESRSAVAPALEASRRLKKKHGKVNWVEKGAVTPIKNQGACGSCWAFSAVGAIEGAHALLTGQLTNFSVQELVDCDWSDLGCFGGLMDRAFAFDEKSGGLCTWEDYPYEARRHWLRGCASKQGKCTPVAETQVDTYQDIDHSHDALHEAIDAQPVSVAIEADQNEFRFYKSGIYDNAECGTKLDHGVLAVGYGSENGADYYLVKNSWGEQWGEDGYIKLSVDSNNADTEGQCGILMTASRPLLKAAMPDDGEE